MTSIGVRPSAHLNASGRAMLAVLPITRFDAIYSADATLPLRGGTGTASVAELSSLLEVARGRGWAVEDGDINLEYASVASAVLDHNGYPLASVGLTFRRTIVDDA